MTFFTAGILGPPRIFSPVLASSNGSGSIQHVGHGEGFPHSFSGSSTALTSDSVRTDIPSLVKEKKGNGFAAKEQIGGVKPETDKWKTKAELPPEKLELELLDEDWYSGATETVKDYLDISKDLIRPDGGPPRWFCPITCGKPIEKSPLLLFLPGMDGIGMGLILHHKALGRIFEVRCMHIPIHDRTPFEGLVKFVEDTLKFEHSLSPNKPIYLVGDSFGGCLALAIAARNPTIDLVLILANPATSFGKSQLQPLLPLLEHMPGGLHDTVPYLLSFVMGDPVKMAMASVETGLPPTQTLDQLAQSLTSLLPRLSILADIIPKETLLWKLKLLKSASSYANSRLHAVKAEVLVLASGNDQMLPSKDEAARLFNLLPNSKVRYFKDHGHTILLEDGINLVTIIKGTNMYRRSRQRDYVLDYLPPTMCEYKHATEEQYGFFYQATSPVMFSTLNDGKIVRGLAGIPNEGPVLLVGYHMLMGLELSPLIAEFLKEKKVLVRGLAHPVLFTRKAERSSQEPSALDTVKLFGPVPVSASNFFRLLSGKSFVLLYPGGAREALHRKGEEYKLFWPDQPEFVRMAARFGATIVPFGVVGEDDIAQLLLDYNDLINIPVVKDWIKELNQDAVRLRKDGNGEVGNQDICIPAVLPKIPGRFYYLFGKPIQTRDRMKELKDRENALLLYHEIKSEVERIISYLKEKRGEDPYRSILPRSVYEATWGFSTKAPTFEP